MKLTDDIFEILKLKTTVYHYTTSKIALEKILPFDSILMNHLKNTNDPREYKSISFFSTGWGDFEDPTDKIGQAIIRVDEMRKNDFQMLSFSRNKDKLYSQPSSSIFSQMSLLGCCKPRMWAQYGDNHQGIVFAFNSEVLIKSIKSQLMLDKDIIAQNINYEPFDLKAQLTLNSNKILEQNIDDYCMSFLLNQKDFIFFNKNPDFQDENEFRIILKSKNFNRISISIKDSLIAVLIGDRFPDGLLPSLRFLCKQLDVDCKRIHWDGGRAEIWNCSPLDHNLYDRWKLIE